MDDLKIGMAFSGGGYRAATFDLGSLSFLNSVKVDNDRTLLDCVVALSSVSGGTITALKYMLAKAKGQKVDDMVKELYGFLCNEDLVTGALQQLSDQRADRNVSSIKIMADIYDTCLFNNAELGFIMDNYYDEDNKVKIPVVEYTALATDFEYSLPFRFLIAKPGSTNAVFGNQKHNISKNVAKHITLGEALACSSCFPSGFEPMMFPDDFKLSKKDEIAREIDCRFGIMDGGVVDNQGIDPIILAEGHMRNHREDKTLTDKALDLVIVSDVASPYMKGYEPSEQMLPDCLGKLTMGRLRNYGWIAQGILTVLFVLTLIFGNSFWTGVTSVLFAIITLINIIGALLKSKLFRAIAKTFVGNRASFISHLKFATLESMLMNRAKSVVMMSSVVFLKRLRQMGYHSLYNDDGWKNRIITNAIYELREDEKWAAKAKNGTIPSDLVPSPAMKDNSALAAAMGTTLWFTNEDKEDGVPQAIMAAGQYTMCYNLLDYIYKIENLTENLNDHHKLIINCKSDIQQAWQRFKEDPQWMLKSMLEQ